MCGGGVGEGLCVEESVDDGESRAQGKDLKQGVVCVGGEGMCVEESDRKSVV